MMISERSRELEALTLLRARDILANVGGRLTVDVEYTFDEARMKINDALAQAEEELKEASRMLSEIVIAALNQRMI